MQLCILISIIIVYTGGMITFKLASAFGFDPFEISWGITYAYALYKIVSFAYNTTYAEAHDGWANTHVRVLALACPEQLHKVHNFTAYFQTA